MDPLTGCIHPPPPPAHCTSNIFDCDVVRIRSGLLRELENSASRVKIRHLRIDLTNDDRCYDTCGWEAHSSYMIHSTAMPAFGALQSIDVLVEDGLANRMQFIEETYWGSCPRGKVRIVDGKTGE
ncbi:hypothetical protein BU25DRAFT_124923 [Macroventuria anomochaeta]|uniref:Uncharacterized protein n=1 Tax=Macroventuria anomochaeta TaxID=301207 RepID=A0ACB6RTU4_9PLEO|nr:uncharacterized protein BU25DRAFT_124923 [Macroventuria anomochaeta]KAF2625204.1 hypothetical protein BU25DRAFT_124923 [Macroventuria anomochaeta]